MMLNNKGVNSSFFFITLLVVTIGCSRTECFKHNIVLGKWDIQKVVNLTEGGEFSNDRELDYYFEFNEDESFIESLFHRTRNGSWNIVCDSIYFDYKDLGRVNYKIRAITDTTIALYGNKDGIEIEYVLTKNRISED